MEILKWKYIPKVKNSLNWINIRLETPEEKVSELEERSIEVIQSEEQREERLCKLKRDVLTYGIIISSLIWG